MTKSLIGQKPAYWAKARRHLAREDAVLASIIQAHPRVTMTRRSDPFCTLARSIVGQQISVKAAATVWGRFEAAVQEVVPERVLSVSPTTLQGAGLSRRKVEYVHGLAEGFRCGEVRPQDWPDMDDEAVIEQLTAVRGIGRWTAEMFLMFNLLRPDVLPLDDVGLQKAVAHHYFRGRRVTARTIRRVAAKWAPWRSVATWYLWRSLDPVPVEY